jgi:hypothetical protein
MVGEDKMHHTSKLLPRLMFFYFYHKGKLLCLTISIHFFGGKYI